MSENAFKKKGKKMALHSKPDQGEIEKAKTKTFSFFEKDLNLLDEVCRQLESATRKKMPKSLALRVGLYYLAESLEQNGDMTEEVENALKNCY